MTRVALLFMIFFFARPLAQSEAQNAGQEDAKLAKLFQEYLDEEFRHRPLEATRAGDHRHDHQLDDVSAKARTSNHARLQHTLAELPKRIYVGKLTRDGQLDFEIWMHHLKRELWLTENTRPFEEDPRVY